MGFLQDLIDRGKSFLGADHEAVQTHAIETDRFDEAYWKDVKHNVPGIGEIIDNLGIKYDHVDEFVEDLFQSAYKADPVIRDDRDMKPSHLPNRTMVEELTSSQQFQSLKTQTTGDEYSSAFALLSMETAIREAEHAMVEAKKAAEEAQKAADEAGQQQQGVPGLDPNAMGPTPDPNGQPGGPGMGNALGGVAAAQQAAANAHSQAQQQAQQAAAGVKAAMRAAAQQAADDLDQEQQLMSAFGVDDGDLQRMSFEERRALAEQLRSNRLAQFTKLLGQFKTIQRAESRRKVQHKADEVVGVRLGNDLVRMIPAEMLNLATPELEDDFWQRWADHAILEFDLRGSEKLGQGPIICVVDESGSMGAADVAGGTREAWSKALALAMCDQARQKGRDFHYIGFSSSRQHWIQSFVGGKTEIAKVIEMTEHFYCGGTSYEEPLNDALKLIETAYDNFGKPRPDIVFISDDEYGAMDADFMHNWNRVKDKTDVRCFGVALGCGFSGAMQQISDNVRSLTDITSSDPSTMADLFRTI